ncbi:hypothetical protein AB6A40_007652 [Gnathostoma spinigerum]|uniref:Uncharacterized protein n=1 Tax=Gnathostoma spinigerum TaxID=75299 RepID=A0ABD6EM42_9BILA
MHGDLNSAETKLLNNKKIHQTNGKRTNGSRRKSKQKPMRNCDVGLHQAESYPQWRLNESSELHENTSSFEKLEVGHWIVDECQSGPIDDAVCETAVPKDFLLESTASRRRGRACHKDKSAQMQKKGAAKNLSELNEDWCTQGCFAQSDLSKEGMQLIKQYKKELLVGNWSSSQPQESSRHVPCIDSVQPPDALLKDSLVIKETMKKNKGRKRIRGSKRTLNSNAVMSPGNCQHGEEINGETSLGNEIPTIEKLTQQQTKLQSEFLGDDRKEQLNYPRFETRLTKNQINSTECCDSGSRHNNYRSRKSLDCKKYSSKKSENNNMQGNHRFSESHEEMFLTCDEVEKSPQEETLKSRSSNRVALDEKMDDEKGTEEYEERVVKDNSDWRKGENNVTRQLTKAQGNEENVGANNLKYGEKRGNSAEKVVNLPHSFLVFFRLYTYLNHFMLSLHF